MLRKFSEPGKLGELRGDSVQPQEKQNTVTRCGQKCCKIHFRRGATSNSADYHCCNYFLLWWHMEK